MKKIFLWMPAAILFSSLMMASCVGFADSAIGVEDNPTEPTKKPETASAKDPGKWWIDENNMDKSVNPGDNFFMYCNGSWWKNTALDQADHQRESRCDGPPRAGIRQERRPLPQARRPHPHLVIFLGKSEE